MHKYVTSINGRIITVYAANCEEALELAKAVYEKEFGVKE